MTIIQNWKDLKYYIKSDLFRYMTSVSYKSFIRAYLIPGFRYTFWLRCCQFAKYNHRRLFFCFARFMVRHYSIKYGIMIPYQTTIGKGLYIGHFSCIVVNAGSVIGDNVNLSQGVTLGQKNGGSRAGSPIVGDAVYFAAGAKVIGNCRIGNRAVIGANSVVTRDVEENAVVVGLPAKVISYKGSYDYVGSFFE